MAEKRIPSFCTQCRSRCGCEAVVADGRLVAVEPLKTHPTGEKLCPKGRAAPELVYHPDRLTQPLKRTNPKGAKDPGWRPVTWTEALDEIAAHLRTIAADHGPEQVAFSVATPSGTHTSDGIGWMQRFIRAYGSPNTIYATEICNWHKDFATRFTFGHDIGTPDFAHTDCIVLWGNNPAATWLARSIEVQKGLKRGARMIVVDPRPTAFARQATRWLGVRPGTDQALALGLANLLLSKNTFAHDVVADWSNASFLVRRDTGRFLRDSDLRPDGRSDVLFSRDEGSGDLLAYDVARGCWTARGSASLALRWSGDVQTRAGAVSCRTALEVFAEAAAAFPPERVADITGVGVDDLAAAADVLASSASVAYYAWNGVGQSITATQTDRAISILYALTGSYGRRGGNVPGAVAPFGDISGMDLLPPSSREKTLGLAERPLGPGLMGWVTGQDVYRAVVEKVPYPIRMLFSFGGNILVTQPDTVLARRALERLDFHVHADFFLNATAAFADIVLPVATSWEREGLRTGFDGSLEGLRLVQLRPQAIDPIGEAKSDIDILLELSGRLGLADVMYGLEADRGHNAMLGSSGLTVDDLRRAPAGIVLDPIALDGHAVDVAGHPRGFPTPTRKIEIYSEQLLAAGYRAVPVFDPADLLQPDERYPLQLCSAKTVAYCHSQHRNIQALRKLEPDPVLQMAEQDAARRSIANGDWVRVLTSVGSVVARAVIVASLPPGAVFGQHGWWVAGAPGTPHDEDHPLAANFNNAVPTDRRDPVSGSAPLRSSWCEVERIAVAATGATSAV